MRESGSVERRRGRIATVAIYLIIAAFDKQPSAEEALKTLRKSRDLELIGVQAAVAMRKDDKGQTHLKDVGLMPGKGALTGAVLGTAAGVLTGGTVVALGTLGALVGAYVGKRKREGLYSTESASRLAASLAPDSSALLLVLEPGWSVVLLKELETLGGSVRLVPVSPALAEQLKSQDEEAFSALENELALAEHE